MGGVGVAGPKSVIIIMHFIIINVTIIMYIVLFRGIQYNSNTSSFSLTCL